MDLKSSVESQAEEKRKKLYDIPAPVSSPANGQKNRASSSTTPSANLEMIVKSSSFWITASCSSPANGHKNRTGSSTTPSADSETIVMLSSFWTTASTFSFRKGLTNSASSVVMCQQKKSMVRGSSFSISQTLRNTTARADLPNVVALSQWLTSVNFFQIKSWQGICAR